MRKLLKPLDENRTIVPSKATLAAYLREWLVAIEPEIKSQATLVRYRGLVENNIVPRLGHVPLQKLEPLQIQAFYSELLNNGRKKGKGGLSPLTVRHVHALLRNALRRAVQFDKLTTSPIERGGVKPPAARDEEARALEPSERTALLAAAQGDRIYAAVLFSMGTGVRRGELVALKWTDIQDNVARIRRAAGQARGQIQIKAPKSRAGNRTITLPDSVVSALHSHRAIIAAERLRAGPIYHDERYVFPNRLGGLWKPDTFTGAFRKLARSAGLAWAGHHSLRHTHATVLLNEGVSLKTVAQRLGHSDVALTLRTYAHVLVNDQDEAAARMNRVLLDAGG